MLINLAGAGLAVHGAHAVAVLANFDGGPVALAKGGNQAGHEAGLADVARVPADDDEGHGPVLSSQLWNCLQVLRPRHRFASPAAPALPVPSNTAARAVPACPKKPRLAREPSSWGAHRIATPGSHLVRCGRGPRCPPDRQSRRRSPP